MKMDWSPAAAFMTASYIPGWQGEFLFHPSSWAPGKKTVGEFSNMSSSEFAKRFTSKWGADASLTYHGAAAFGGLCALAKAIETANSVDTQAVAAELYAQNFREFYADFRFGATGQAILPFLIMQHATSGQNIIYPANEASTTAPTFPAPTWKKRYCRRYGPSTSGSWAKAGTTGWDDGLQVLSAECSGFGSCNDLGKCDCTQGRTGTSCEMGGGSGSSPIGSVGPEVLVPLYLMLALVLAIFCMVFAMFFNAGQRAQPLMKTTEVRSDVELENKTPKAA